MMTDRFTKINDLAEVEWRLVNAELVKEHFEATVLPNPLNLFENIVDMVRTAHARTHARAQMHTHTYMCALARRATHARDVVRLCLLLAACCLLLAACCLLLAAVATT
jgi:hypothetical protein